MGSTGGGDWIGEARLAWSVPKNPQFSTVMRARLAELYRKVFFEE
jgi:hypothetical protein